MKHTYSAKRILSILLVLSMLLSLCTVWAFALEKTDGVYTISTLAELQEFASMVNGGDTFADRTVRLEDDISGLTAPIGSSSKKFAGTFDGNGHTITVAISGTTYQGLFAYNNGTIRNLIVAGTVAGSMYGGAFCGYNNGTIESCINEATGSFTGSYVGGFAGFNSKTASITNCINRGNVTTTSSGGYCGGIAGSNSGAISNCYNTGTIGNSTKSFAIVGAGTGTVTNCYFLSGGTDAKATEKTDAEMKSTDFVALLGSGFHYLEGSYPVLTWQGGVPVTPAHTEHTYGEWSSDGPDTHSRSCTFDGCTEKQTEKHTWDSGTVTTAPTEEQPGEKTYTCEDCKGTKTEPIPAISKTVTVSFYDGETLYGEIGVAAGSKVETLPENPTKTGYNFLHWSTAPKGTAFDFSTAITTDLTLYAVWRDNAAANWEYVVIDEGTAVKLTKYKGTSATVITPETLDGLPVTTIGKETFTGNTNITYVKLNNSITTVEDGTGLNGGAFRGCTKLRTVILSEKMTRIADYMFYGLASGIEYPVQINFQKVTEIGDYAFSCCNNIVKLELPKTVTKIGQGAFYQARRLATLDMPGVCEVGADAFTETIFEENYENLWEAGEFSGVVYADKVAYLYMGDMGDESKDMAANTEIVLKDGALGISEFIFVNHFVNKDSCRTNLKSITVPATVKYIAPDIFNGFAAVTDDDFTGVDLYGISSTYAETYANDYANIRFNSIGDRNGYDWNNADYDWYDNAVGRNYVIRTVDELRAFSDLLNIGEDNFAGATVTLAADLDLGGLTSVGYGLEGFAWDLSFGANFAGTFDGQNYTISGMYMNYAQDKVGFFDELAGTAVVKNLTVEGRISGWDYVGSIVGFSASGAVIENCTFRGSVTGDSVYGNVGGIAGRAMKTTISGCTASGSVDCTMAEAYREYQQGYVGGIVGHNYGSTVTDCVSEATVTGNGFGTGGITGFSQLASVTDCVNKGTVDGYENVGGIVGKIQAAVTMGSPHSGCRNEGAVSGVQRVGGIAGFSVGVVKVDDGFQTVVNSVNKGSVSATYHAGGIIGYVHDSVAELCCNSGSVSATAYAGGICGYSLGTRVLNSYNTGAISAFDCAGGILAFDADAEGKIENCYNIGTIEAEEISAPLAYVYGGGNNAVNSYYLTADAEDEAAEAKTADAFRSGEVAWLLGEAYGQKLGQDAYPVFRGDDNTVYRYCCVENIGYSNDSSKNGEFDAHSWDHGVVTKRPTYRETGEMLYTCTICGETKTTVLSKLVNDLSTPDQEQQAKLPFRDVTENDWFYGDVLYVYEAGLMSGTSAQTFDPSATTTRAMIVTVLYRLEGEPQAAAGSAFSDVADGQYYRDAVAWATENQIVTGYGDGRFGPEDCVTREQLAAILFRYAAFKGLDIQSRADLSSYTDAPQISDYAVDAMAWANAQGIINGLPDATLAASGTATRAQLAAILHRYLTME